MRKIRVKITCWDRKWQNGSKEKDKSESIKKNERENNVSWKSSL